MWWRDMASLTLSGRSTAMLNDPKPSSGRFFRTDHQNVRPHERLRTDNAYVNEPRPFPGSS